MDTSSHGWTVRKGNHGGNSDGLLKQQVIDNNATNLHVQDLFHEDARQSSRPWWKIKLFVWEPVLFGTWDGVFTTCMINIFGVVLFLRSGYLVGNTGVLLGMLLVSLVVQVALVTVMSGIGVGEHCGYGGGGIYSMISTVLGTRVGGTMGLLYVFGQCVAGAMYITGFSESVAELLGLQSQWAVHGMSAAVLLALLGINLAGVKWIVRLQLILLAILAVSTLDFVIGTFTHLDPDHGFTGYSAELLRNNSKPDYSAGENFFTVFGVFFPAATGVMSGFNMSSDLQRPEHNIPVGTLTAVFTSWFLYLVFAFLLGAVCSREALRYDFLIAEKVSLVGFLFLLGLYISSLASCMGGLYGAPRILQCIAQERVIPALACLGKGNGPNKTPVAAICLTSLLTMAFIFIGQVNVLAPIVTINFMLTYSFIDYSYFSVAMTYRLQEKGMKDVLPLSRRKQHRSSNRTRPLIEAPLPNYGSGGQSHNKGTLSEFTKDMNQIFPPLSDVNTDADTTPSLHESTGRGRSRRPTAKQTLMDSFGLDLNSNMFSEEDGSQTRTVLSCDEPDVQPGNGELKMSTKPCSVEQGISRQPHDNMNNNTGDHSKSEAQTPDIRPMPDLCYTKFCNHWISLFGALLSVIIMFVIHWVYAIVNVVVALMLFFYIGKTSPGLPTGVAARFSFFTWLKSTLKSICRGKGSLQEEMVVTPSISGVGLQTRQLTEENADFASRHRCHKSSLVAGKEMVQPQFH